MSTEQSYVGRDCYAIPLAQNGLPGHYPALLATPRPILTAQVYHLQTQLLRLIDQAAAQDNYVPLLTSDAILQYWLPTPVATLTSEVTPDELQAAQLLVDRLAGIYASAQGQT